MNLRRAPKLLWTFYRYSAVPNGFMTLICATLFWEYGPPIFAAQLFLKVVTMTIVSLFVRSHYKHEFYYYQNLGLTRVFLWTITLFFDLLIYFTVLFVLASHRPVRQQKDLQYEASISVISNRPDKPSRFRAIVECQASGRDRLLCRKIYRRG